MLREKITFKESKIQLSHGAGGKASRRLIEGLIAPYLKVETLNDAAHVQAGSENIAFTSDSFVVNPLKFPGDPLVS